MRKLLIYDSEGSYTHSTRAPDRTLPLMAPPVDDVDPIWSIHLHVPDAEQDQFPGHAVPHSTLEWMCSWHGFDPDELATILDVVFHSAHIPDPDDVLAWMDPARCKLMQVVHEDLPDPLLPMPYTERREVMLARVAAVKAHHLAVEPASWEDRAGALYARAQAIRDVEARLAEHGVQLPPQFKLGLDDEAPDHPLDPILSVARLDPARVAARRSRDEWIQAARDANASRAMAAMRSPMTFGVLRKMPPSAADMLAGLTS